jgi:hypothetical protein
MRKIFLCAITLVALVFPLQSAFAAVYRDTGSNTSPNELNRRLEASCNSRVGYKTEYLYTDKNWSDNYSRRYYGKYRAKYHWSNGRCGRGSWSKYDSFGVNVRKPNKPGQIPTNSPSCGGHTVGYVQTQTSASGDKYRTRTCLRGREGGSTWVFWGGWTAFRSYPATRGNTTYNCGENKAGDTRKVDLGNGRVRTDRCTLKRVTAGAFVLYWKAISTTSSKAPKNECPVAGKTYYTDNTHTYIHVCKRIKHSKSGQTYLAWGPKTKVTAGSSPRDINGNPIIPEAPYSAPKATPSVTALPAGIPKTISGQPHPLYY